MAKTVLKVTILSCGRKAKDRTEKEYEIDFTFSNLEKVIRPTGGIREQYFEPGSEVRAQVLYNDKIEIL